MATTYPHHDIGAACKSADDAFTALAALSPGSRAEILDSIAIALDARSDDILTTCADETALTIDELTPEFARMTGTLRMFGALGREGSWVRAAIDTPSATPIGPNHDIRSLLAPLGPVAVFGSSNFPLAYGVCGGDMASALAAGCPVIVKEHPAHPKTGRLLAEIAQQVTHIPLNELRLPGRNDGAQTLGYLHNEDPKDFTVAQQLVQHPATAAIGFTGSTAGGLALDRLARTRLSPIPVYAEMGSLNAVSITHEAFVRRGQQIADELVTAILNRVGQQCTKPGVVLLDSDVDLTALYHLVQDRIAKSTPRRMLSRTVAENYYRRVFSLATHIPAHARSPLPSDAQRDAMLGVPMVFWCGEEPIHDIPAAREEIFGPAVVLAIEQDYPDEPLPNRLTHSIYAEGEERLLVDLVSRERAAAGRIIFNGVPTGVRVATSMVHGGPFPATNRPDTTAVGARAIERWCRPVCYQNCPDALLPPELQNANPRGIWRNVNSELTKSPVG